MPNNFIDGVNHARNFARGFKKCTVRISHEGQQGHDGSGFFVTPQLILTCAHVCLKANGKQIYIDWEKQRCPVKIKFCPENIEILDLALLEIVDSRLKPPHVYIDETLNIGDQLYNFGYPERNLQGDVEKFQFIGFDGQDLIKFKDGTVRGGLSGSPLLNLRTNKVCGMVIISLGTNTDFGGRAISTTTVFQYCSEIKEFHQSLEKTVYPNPFIPRTGKIADINLLLQTRESEIKEIFAILNSGSGVALIGEQGIGKSSLLNLIINQTENRLKKPRKPIYLDFGNVIQENDFYYGLCSHVGIKCNHAAPPKGTDLTNLLKNHRLLLLLDGLRRDMVWEGFTNPVRNQLRSLANDIDAPLLLVVAADQPLTKLFADSGEILLLIMSV